MPDLIPAGLDADERSAQAASLLEQARREGSLPLGSLSDVEECVLGGDRWLMVDASVWLAWTAIGDEARARHASATVRDLVERRDAVPVDEAVRVEGAGGEPRLVLSVPLGIVELVRTSAYFVVAPSTVPAASGVLAPLLYGFVDEVGGLRGLVAELRPAGRHDYRLLSVEHACSALAEWAQGALRSEAFGGRADAVTLEVLRHREGEPLLASGLSVRVDGQDLRGATLLFGGTRERFDAGDRDTLTAQVRTLLEQAARTTGETAVSR